MIIVADIGNSYLKMARWDGKTLSEQVRVRHRDLLDSDWQATLDESVRMPSDGVFVASVADQSVNQTFESWLLSRGHLRPVYLKSEAEAGGVRNGYEAPATLGVDRWCALVAARAAFAGPICVVDAGTAMTIDWLDAEGRHRGGMIMPGPNLQAESLIAGTSDVHESAPAPAHLFASNTSEGVAAGVCHGCAALIERAVEHIEEASEAEARLVLTGGEIARIQPLLSRDAESDQDLVLRGVAILAAGIEA